MAEPQVEPPSGLGNFKGVMLCTRPDEGGRPADAGPAPFRSAVASTYGERLGLNPTGKEVNVNLRDKPKNVALDRHLQWLKQLQAEMQKARAGAAEAHADKLAKDIQLRAFSDRAREQVREMKAAAYAADADAKKPPVKEAPKPKWAMTEEQCQEFDDEETCELLDFVDQLNFDEYIQDIEFRGALAALHGRARRLDREQDSFRKMLCEQFNAGEDGEAEDLDPAPAAAKPRSDRDGQSVASEAPSVAVSETPSRLAEAQRLLKENPALAQVHSAASVQKILEKQKGEKEA